jgi:streptomycin 3"-adenylyltransferase
VYLHGSAVLGCFGPLSDVDLVAVAAHRLGRGQKRQLADILLDISGSPRPVELDLVLLSALRDWRHPAPFEFHYAESLRDRFRSGEHEPWESSTNRDLAAHVVVVRNAGVAIVGPPPGELFPDIPADDFRDALLYDVTWWREHVDELELIPGGIRNAVLSLARIWATLATGRQHSKATGTDWALPRLTAELRPVLERGRDLYIGKEGVERWAYLPVATYIESVAAEIDHLA